MYVCGVRCKLGVLSVLPLLCGFWGLNSAIKLAEQGLCPWSHLTGPTQLYIYNFKY